MITKIKGIQLNQEDVLKIHKNYEYDTEESGKYIPTSEGWDRYYQIQELVPSQSVVLEVGCNSGGLLRALVHHKQIVPYGIDVCKGLIKRAQQKGIIAIEGKAEDLPYEDRFFDVCIISEVLEHLYDDKIGFKELLRVLKPGGLVIATVPHPAGWVVRKRPIERHLYHMRNYSRGQFRKLLSSGLRYIKIKNIYDLYHSPYWQYAAKDNPRWMLGWGFKK